MPDLPPIRTDDPYEIDLGSVDPKIVDSAQAESRPGNGELGTQNAIDGLDPSLPPHASSLGSPEPVEVAGPSIRDRIVVLGRRRAGKTIYLARLYESAWNGRIEKLHMRALPGPGNGHERFMDTIARLQRGEWPAATVGSTSTHIDVEYMGEKHLLIALDYPGEVFRRAFVQASPEDAAMELRDHVDRAAGVILLLDPEVAVTGQLEEAVDDDYGMAEAILRIRSQPGGEDVPIAIVLTKCDLHASIIKDEGGLRAFIKKHYYNILKVAQQPNRRFAASAVRTRMDARGNGLPTLKHDPVNILEPMVYCIERMTRSQRQTAARDAAVAFDQAQHEQLELLAKSQKQSAMKWAIGVTLAILVLGLFVFILSQIFKPEPAPAEDLSINALVPPGANLGPALHQSWNLTVTYAC